MAYNPVKKTELTVPHPLSNVRDSLMKAASPKRQKNAADPEYRIFYGKVNEGSFRLTPNTGHRNGYSPVVTGNLTEVTESRPGSAEQNGYSGIFTRLNMEMKLTPAIKVFTVLWLIVCVALLGLAVWQCFRKGFAGSWWLLLIGPALFLLERAICNIGFSRSSRRTLNELKKLLDK